ncbi:MAG: hypothetical protein K9M57_10100 [Phycisphaerae bacterium]|nr:hypothetical protein [Phycisphaerae bacterium]
MVSAIENKGVHCPEDYGEPFTASRYASNAELAEVINQAIKSLPYDYRTVLVLWCFEQRSWSEIAGLMDSNENHVRMQFYCAKWALQCSLAVNGFSRNILPEALGLYGRKIDIPSVRRLPGMIHVKLEEN